MPRISGICAPACISMINREIAHGKIIQIARGEDTVLPAIGHLHVIDDDAGIDGRSRISEPYTASPGAVILSGDLEIPKGNILGPIGKIVPIRVENRVTVFRYCTAQCPLSLNDGRL